MAMQEEFTKFLWKAGEVREEHLLPSMVFIRGMFFANMVVGVVSNGFIVD